MFSPDRRPPSIKSELKSWQGLCDLAIAISRPESLDFAQLQNNYLSSKSHQQHVSKGTQPLAKDFVRLLTEMHIAQVVRNSGNWVNNSIEIIRNSLSEAFALIPNPDTLGAELFLRGPDEKLTAGPIAEFDALVVSAEQLKPVIIEVEFGTAIYKSSRKKRRLNRRLKPDRIELISKILNRSKSFGYLMVVEPSNYSPQSSPVQKEFIEKGGIIVPFPRTRNDFMIEAKKIRESIYLS